MSLLIRGSFLSSRSLTVSNLLTRTIFLPVKNENTPKPSIVLSADGGTVICWHPQRGYPYEKTRALPYNEESIRAGSSVLKVQHMEASEMMTQPRGPDKYQLGEMFQVPFKHFRPRPNMNKSASVYKWMHENERDSL